ncbi:MAG: methylated-DNA--[protein]-cysteine S-methyltransferase [Dehalococcoidia bacterium]
MTADRYHICQVSMGWVGLVGSDFGLSRLSFKPNPQEVLEDLGSALDHATEDAGSFTDTVSCLERYFQGETGALDEIDLDLRGVPPFFGEAWIACRTIPPGETRSYAWLASEAGRPLAARAAGQAMAKNPYALIIPCHRVIASNGDLRGYGAGGLSVKAKLLQMEQKDNNSGDNTQS